LTVVPDQGDGSVGAGSAGDLPGGDGGKLLGEAGVEVGLLEDVRQVEHTPAPFHLGLEGRQVGRLGHRRTSAAR